MKSILAITLLALSMQASAETVNTYDDGQMTQEVVVHDQCINDYIQVVYSQSDSNSDIDAAISKVMTLDRKWKIRGSLDYMAHGFDAEGYPVVVIVRVPV